MGDDELIDVDAYAAEQGAIRFEYGHAEANIRKLGALTLGVGLVELVSSVYRFVEVEPESGLIGMALAVVLIVTGGLVRALLPIGRLLFTPLALAFGMQAGWAFAQSEGMSGASAVDLAVAGFCLVGLWMMWSRKGRFVFSRDDR